MNPYSTVFKELYKHHHINMGEGALNSMRSETLALGTFSNFNLYSSSFSCSSVLFIISFIKKTVHISVPKF
jgi:hypothetical protein